MDTKEFNGLTPDEYKSNAAKNWNAAPCGANYADGDTLDAAFFQDVEKHRYATHPWILHDINGFDVSGKKTLEVGFGMGTDHVTIARRGGIMFGIDMTPRHLEICRERMRTFGLRSELLLGDAENLPYKDGSFDFVCSFGVIHHAPDTEKAISEIRRVLKPSGKCHIVVYNKNSVFFWWTVFLYRHILRGGFRKWTLKQQLSLVEYPNTNPGLVVRLYGKKEFAAMFTGFKNVSARVHHLLPADIAIFGRLFKRPGEPNRLLAKIGEIFGWYIVVRAEKE